MDGMKIFILLIVSCFSITEGQVNAQVEYEDSCYSVGQTLTIEAVYTGGGIPDAVQWSYSGGTGTNLIVDTSGCTRFGAVPAGYPIAARMAYKCSTTDAALADNTYILTVTGLTSDESTDLWGATFTPPSGTAPAAVQVAIPICTTTDGTPEDDDNGLSTGAIVGIVIGSVVSVIIIVVVILAIMGKLPGNKPGRYDPTNNSHGDKP